MADTKLSSLTELAAPPAADDELYIRDVSEVATAESKRITMANLVTASITAHSGLTEAHGATGSVVGTTNTQELSSKTLNASVAKGTWTTSGTWTIPAVTLGGAVAGGTQNITGLGTVAATSYATTAAIPLLLTNGQLVNIALISQTVGATTLTIPDFASVVDEFTFKTKAQTMANKTLTSPTINGTIATTGLTLPAVTLGGALTAYAGSGIVRTATKVVAASDADATVKLQADYVCDGTADDVEIQAAIDALTAGRTWKEKVVCMGNFLIADAISLPSYTILEIQGRIYTATAAIDMIINSEWVTGNTAIEVYGGILDGGGVAHRAIDFRIVSNYSVHNVVFNPITLLGSHFDNWGNSFGNIYGNVFNCDHKGLPINILDSSHDISIFGNQMYYPYDSGIDFGMASADEANPVERCSFIGNTVFKDQDDENGFGVGVHNNVQHIVISGNIISGCHFDGIHTVQGAGLAQPRYITITNNDISDCERDGIVIESPFSVVANNRISLLGVGLAYPQGLGIVVERDNSIVQGNVILNCIRGIVIGPFGTTALNTVIGNNLVTDNRTPAQLDYGVVINANCDYTLVKGNNVRGNLTAGIFVNGTGTSNCKISDNLGYVTENSGTATIVSGQTTIVVTHGLATTPTRVYITPTNSMGLATNFWVDTLTTTQFTINVNTDPGATTAIFNWKAVIGEGN